MANSVFPLNLHQTLLWKVRNFPEDVYNFDIGDKLTTLMSIVLGNTGTGQLWTSQLAARLTQENMEFSDLDNIFGQILNTPRLSTEMYATSKDPFLDQLTSEEWQDVISKDSAYRERLNGVASSLLKGATTFGIQQIAESTADIQAKVIEVWNTTASGTTTAQTLASGVTTRGLGDNEVLVIPTDLPDVPLTTDFRAAVMDSLRQLKPAGVAVTLTSGVSNLNSLPYTVVTGNSVNFYMERTTTAANLSYPSLAQNSPVPGVASRYWAQNNVAVQAPYFAHLQTQESYIDVTQNISTVNITLETPGGPNTTYGVTSPLGKANLKITSTVYGAL